MTNQSAHRQCGFCYGSGVYTSLVDGSESRCPSCGGNGKGFRWLTSRAGWVEAGRTLRFMGIDGLLICLDGPVEYEPGVEGKAFIHARSVSTGVVHSLDASHPAWVLATEAKP